jgi:imidazole glycerol-phosphate synthase subunit HisF
MALIPRIIPALLLKGQGLVKTVGFKNPVYLGDPINVVRIFNDKEIDEIVLLDITATAEGKVPNFPLLEEVATECFAPMAYGGGIRDLATARRILALGFEKVVLNSISFENPGFLRELADTVGSQSVVASIDVQKSLLGRYTIKSRSGTKSVEGDVCSWAEKLQKAGAGEILLNSIDRDGKMQGYDLALIRRVSQAVDIPVVACGGAGKAEHLKEAISDGGASAAAAGSLFVFQGVHRAVLISFPERKVLESMFIGPAVKV